ncbi:LacI family transcriptional regulator [Kibdelosporangium philippinense]|uniref:LacI family transcriptional regulator n=1 Tax=Kibdelosporangium philippinense TaxID=211113 RepID=A0ABS8ZR93_9PSEU|nr:LacI family DNA-binding transcriptional regulator [Kibdelosporangium philippinense]MCE7010235.1 LacI family transcriptional regulator [Kibdelosporangium philippinense]
MPRPTLADVARAAGVHPGTASRALNPDLRGRIAEETTKRVREAAERLGYVVDSVGRSLRTGRSRTIGVLVPDLTNPAFPGMIRGIEDELRVHDYAALLANTDNEVEREAELVATLKARQCDGFIIASAMRDDPVVRELVTAGDKVVLINRLLDDTTASAVVSDDQSGIAAAVHHLHGLGHNAIGHIAGPRDLSITRTRRVAYAQSMKALGLRGYVVLAEAYTAPAGHDAALRLLKRSRVTAIVAGNDMLAVGCFKAIEQLGLSCPEDISVVGFNDMPLAAHLRPALTTVRMPQYDMGVQAARLVMKADLSPETVVLPTELVVRASTGHVE